MTVKWNKKVWDNVRTEVKKEIVKQIYGVDAEAKRLIYTVHTPKQGRHYDRGDKVHIASAPGEPFANDTGNAVAQMTIRFEDGGLTGILNFGAEYAPHLEFGTSKMEPRPVARPALKNQEQEIEQGIRNAVQRGIARG